MALTDTFVRTVKPTGEQAKKYTDGDGMYLLVTESGKYSRLNYRYFGKRKTLVLGVYPAVSLSKARTRRAEAQAQLADGVDPNVAKRQQKLAAAAAASQTFETVARSWPQETAASRAATTQEKVTGWLQRSVLPYIGEISIGRHRCRGLACWRTPRPGTKVAAAHRKRGDLEQFAARRLAISTALTRSTARIRSRSRADNPVTSSRPHVLESREPPLPSILRRQRRTPQ
jgi:hypothetical protein